MVGRRRCVEWVFLLIYDISEVLSMCTSRSSKIGLDRLFEVNAAA
jgi:hypothetical protein